MKEGVLEQDIENSFLNLDHLDPDPMQQVHGHSITYRIAVGPQQSKKVFTLQTLLPRTDEDRFSQVGKIDITECERWQGRSGSLPVLKTRLSSGGYWNIWLKK